ncbi:MAG TPA: VTC domain-containing protein [Oligoflexia bacterium]|nr:VTC domain-containing protein [Oligoflexia bacterium]HMR25304.1 VTC domain-containing protein [Oligoflexia bacterium]
MRISSRIELKYPCSEDHLQKIKTILWNHPSWQLDSHCHDQKPYWVASLYWDTPNLINYHDSQDGVLKKSKLRLRSYASSDINDTGFKVIKAEVKHRQGRVCYKAVKTLHPHILEQDNLLHNDCQSIFGPDLWHFYRKNTPSYKKQSLQAVVTVLYERLSFIHSNQKSRITLDSNIIPLSPDLFLNAFTQRCQTQSMLGVLELKDCDLKYAEINKIIALSDSKKEKFSKYNQALDTIVQKSIFPMLNSI